MHRCGLRVFLSHVILLHYLLLQLILRAVLAQFWSAIVADGNWEGNVLGPLSVPAWLCSANGCRFGSNVLFIDSWASMRRDRGWRAHALVGAEGGWHAIGRGRRTKREKDDDEKGQTAMKAAKKGEETSFYFEEIAEKCGSPICVSSEEPGATAMHKLQTPGSSPGAAG